MQRVFALLAVLCAASAASSRPRVLVSLHANGTFQLEMNQAELHEILGKARNVAVVGGYGMGSGMSTLFNAAALAAEDSTLLGSGFPVAASSRKAAIWIQRPGLLAPNGEDVVFLSCENCYEQFNKSWAAAMHLFHIMQYASHHLIFHSSAPTDSRVQALEIMMRASVRTAFLKNTPQEGFETDDDTAPLNPEVARTPVSWAYRDPGQVLPAAKVAEMTEALSDGTLSHITPFPLPTPVTDSRVALLRNLGEARVSDLEKPFVEACQQVVEHAASVENKRDWVMSGPALWSYYRILVDTVNRDDSPASMPSQSVILSTSMEDRRMFALGLYNDVLARIAGGNREWISRIVPALSHATHDGKLLEAVAKETAGRSHTGRDLVSLVEDVAKTTGAAGGADLWFMQAAPASAEEYKGGEDKAWDFALKFFSTGFGSSDEATTVKQKLRLELAASKQARKEDHKEAVHAYVAQLNSVLREAVDRYYVTHNVPDVCNPEFEKQRTDELLASTASLYGPARKWWPGYELVGQAEKQARNYISGVLESRMKKSSGIIHSQLEEVQKESLQDFKSKCQLPADGSPVKTSELVRACKDAEKAGLDYVRTVALALPKPPCDGDWILKTSSYGGIAKELSDQMRVIERAQLEKNENILALRCVEQSVDLKNRAAAAFEEQEKRDTADEDVLDRLGAEELAKAKAELNQRWKDYESQAVEECIRALTEKVHEELEKTKQRIEYKLFGSEEATTWRDAWTEQVDNDIKACFSCRLHPMFVRNFLTSAAEATAPREIAGQPLSRGFRDSLIKRAVRKDLVEHADRRSSDLEFVVYLTGVVAVTFGSAVAIKAFRS